MKLRELHHALEHVLLRNTAGGVLRLRYVRQLPENVGAGQMDLDGFSRDEQLGIRLFDQGHHLALAHRDVGLSQVHVLFRQRRAAFALAARRKFLRRHRHVEIGFPRVQAVDRPLPDLRFEHGRRQRPLLSRAQTQHVKLATQRGDIQVPCGCGVHRVGKRQRHAVVRPSRAGGVRLRAGMRRAGHTDHNQRKAARSSSHRTVLLHAHVRAHTTRVTRVKNGEGLDQES